MDRQSDRGRQDDAHAGNDGKATRERQFELPYFPLWTSELMAETAHLDDAEFGRYMRLLIKLWRAPDQRIPNNLQWLAKHFSRTIEQVQTELSPIIAEFFQAGQTWITHKRLSARFKQSLRTISQKSRASKSRWQKEKNRSGRNAAPAMQSGSGSGSDSGIESSSSSITTDAAREPTPADASDADGAKPDAVVRDGGSPSRSNVVPYRPMAERTLEAVKRKRPKPKDDPRPRPKPSGF
jgi:uncharacterized protein YdaU (DUF1376 family)